MSACSAGAESSACSTGEERNACLADAESGPCSVDAEKCACSPGAETGKVQCNVDDCWSCYQHSIMSIIINYL